MTRIGMVQAAVAGDVAEAEEMQAILHAAGIEADLQSGDDGAIAVWVTDAELGPAQEALEALTEPDDIIGEP
jgi:type III secretory pathway lipoprotein EscJ